MATIAFGRQVCGSLAAASAREWLVADGLGGYAMGTVGGLRTRRYHGLLVVATEPPIGRRLGLAALDPVLRVGDARVRLATHEWAGGAVSPHGHELLDRFDLTDGIPRWRWSVGGVVLEAELAMAHGQPAVGVVYRLLSAGPHPEIGLDLDALCTWRDVHGERGAGSGEPAVEKTVDGFTFEGAYRVHGPGYEPGGEWYRGVHHREEAARGLAAEEDLWFAGRFTSTLRAGDVVEVAAWSDDLAERPPTAARLVGAARARARAVAVAAGAVDDADALLAHAADQLVVRAPSGPTVVAGYPWFGDWSRDTMTSYEGLFLETGRAGEGAELLRAAAGSLSEGMLANTADAGGTEYNTVDGALWFVHAVGRHVARTGDVDLRAELLPSLLEIVEHHLVGTRFGIRTDDDGLLAQGADGWALTWMDARVDGTPITARQGKPVEVNALWVAALDAVGEPYAALADRAADSFRERFRSPRGGLLDVVDGPGGDESAVRPNQLLAVSLPGGPFAGDGAAARTVLAAVGPLVTSIGLRSLDPADSGYRGRHRGGPADRDAAYHQGTVWPWLVGSWVDAHLTAGTARRDLLDGLDAHLAEWGLGSVSETADGDAPHAATGCPFQAWSVAELLRARRAIRS
jgi:predicted glycogen debranching enzyme